KPATFKIAADFVPEGNSKLSPCRGEVRIKAPPCCHRGPSLAFPGSKRKTPAGSLTITWSLTSRGCPRHSTPSCRCQRTVPLLPSTALAKQVWPLAVRVTRKNTLPSLSVLAWAAWRGEPSLGGSDQRSRMPGPDFGEKVSCRRCSLPWASTQK